MDIKSLLKVSGNEYADVASNGIEAGDILGFIDTGAYSLNAAISGSIYGGWPVGKVSMLAGDPSAGKTFALLTTCKVFLDADPENVVVYFESESAISKSMLEDRGIDVKRFVIMPVTTIQEFRTQAIKVLDHYMETRKKGESKILFGLDSLGMLSTSKEMEDTASGAETKDMTRPAIIKSAFRVLTLKLGRAQVPLVVTNHTYATMDQYNPKEISGGSGAKYAASTIVILNKRKDKDGTEVVGNNIRAVVAKSRLTREFSQVEVLIRFETGMQRFWGLLEIGEQTGTFKKVGNKYEVTPWADGKTYFGTTINKNPEKFFTKDILDHIELKVKDVFGYGAGSEETLEEATAEVDN
jgi:RecA/RadA recombinase